jgi:hypothetical protein
VTDEVDPLQSAMARALAGAHDRSENQEVWQQYPPQSFQGAEAHYPSRSLWGPPQTKESDFPWYIPESMIGELPYRYQGVGLHGLLAAMPPWGLASAANLAYVLGTLALGRTAPLPHVEDQTPPPPSYPPTFDRMPTLTDSQRRAQEAQRGPAPESPDYLNGLKAINAARHEDRDLALRRGITEPHWFNDWIGYLSPEEQAKLDLLRLPGGPGAGPY